MGKNIKIHFENIIKYIFYINTISIFSGLFLYRIDIFQNNSLSIVSVFSLITIFLILIQTLLNKEINKKNLTIFFEKNKLIIIFLLVFILSITDKHGIGICIEWLSIPIILGLISKKYNETSDLIIIGNVIISIISFLNFHESRLIFPFTNANQLAILIAPGLIISFINILNKSNKKIYILNFIILFISVLFTQSFGAILGIGFSIFIFLISKNKQIIKYFILILIILITIFSQTPKFDQMLDLQNRSSSSVRIEIWKVATGLIRENAIQGIGLGNFETKYIENAYRLLGDKIPLEWNHPEPHNIFMSIWLNSGIINLIIFIYLAITKIISKDIYQKHIWIYILIHGIVDTTFMRVDISFLLGM